SRWYHPSTWLADLTVLGTMRVATRWRVMGMLGVALGCGAIISQWRTSARLSLRVLALACSALVALDLGVNAWSVYAQAFKNPPFEMKRSPGARAFVQLEMV